MFYVYLIKSGVDDSLYIGQTENIKERLGRHNAGFVASTRSKRPWSIVGFEGYQTRELARWREYSLKKSLGEKRKFIKKFMSS
jgi:putative endonuclease